MKIKLSPKDVINLEVYVLDKINSNKMSRVKSKFLNPDKNGNIHLSNDEYLFTLTCCENNMVEQVIPIYESLIAQDNKDLVQPIILYTTPII